MSLIVKIIVKEWASGFSTIAEAKTQCFADLCFNSTLKLINGISSNPQKLLRYFDGTVIVAFLRI